mmetsp:Transcript_33719/g.100116  ORF Transcript_33719/g.100116 Transcript_33719/m.100116 type:complete len:343 (-) Transcript_33719:420-1448(-)
MEPRLRPALSRILGRLSERKMPSPRARPEGFRIQMLLSPRRACCGWAAHSRRVPRTAETSSGPVSPSSLAAPSSLSASSIRLRGGAAGEAAAARPPEAGGLYGRAPREAARRSFFASFSRRLRSASACCCRARIARVFSCCVSFTARPFFSRSSASRSKALFSAPGSFRSVSSRTAHSSLRSLKAGCSAASSSPPSRLSMSTRDRCTTERATRTTPSVKVASRLLPSLCSSHLRSTLWAKSTLNCSVNSSVSSRELRLKHSGKKEQASSSQKNLASWRWLWSRTFVQSSRMRSKWLITWFGITRSKSRSSLLRVHLRSKLVPSGSQTFSTRPRLRKASLTSG